MQILLFNKPFNVLCQFTDESEHAQNRENLSHYVKQANFYAAGRLDRDSEGLLLLTDNGKLQQRIADPKFKLPKTYLVQVEGDLSREAIQQLAQGVMLKDGKTLPANAKKVQPPKWLWERNPPIRERKNIPTSWLELTIKEGKNRQVRRMTAAVGFPTLRLIRLQIGPWKLNELQSGELKSVNVEEFSLELPENFLNMNSTKPTFNTAKTQKQRNPTNKARSNTRDNTPKRKKPHFKKS